MTFDQQLQHAFDTFADRLNEEVRRQLASISDELGDTFETELAASAARSAVEAKAAAEAESALQLLAAIAAAEARSTEAIAQAEIRSHDAIAAAQLELTEAREQGRKEGEKAGIETGKQDGAKAARQEGLEQGRLEGIEIGKQEGIDIGRLEGHQAGRQEGLEAGRREGENAGRQAGIDIGKQEGAKAGLQNGRDHARAEFRAMELAANERLIDAIRSIDNGRSLSEILDSLVSCAGREARRVGVLLVRNGQLRGWRFIGFGAPLDERHDFDVPSADSGVIAEAARTGVSVSADSAAKVSVPSFAELPPGREVLAVPVPMSGQVVAVLYADQGPLHGPGTTEAEPRVGWPSTIEVMARHAARCLEAITAFRAAQVLTERPEVPSVKAAAKAIEASSPSASASRGDAGESGDADQAARRYARLLVSEIKLYHEAAVVAGRRERDLATRLGGEIARARVLYEQRVPAEGRKGKDHFQDELVRTLAGGDASLLEVKPRTQQ